MKSTEKFTGKAEIYAKYRPSYPQEYTDYLMMTNSLNMDSMIADIGSGTGIFSRQLLEKGVKVLAVEPNHDMREVAEQELCEFHGFTSIHATAEHTSIRAESVDLITAAQSFHWFDKELFKQECKRILKKKANVALVWNSRDFSSPLIQENSEICKKYCPQFKVFSGGIEETPEIYSQFFKDGKYEFKSFANNLECDFDGFLGRNLSASYAPKETDQTYFPFVSDLSNLFKKYSKNGKLIVPNITRSYLGQV